jgi:hypothetical protein
VTSGVFSHSAGAETNALSGEISGARLYFMANTQRIAFLEMRLALRNWLSLTLFFMQLHKMIYGTATSAKIPAIRQPDHR